MLVRGFKDFELAKADVKRRTK